MYRAQASVEEQVAGFEALVAGWSRPGQSHLQPPRSEAQAKAAADALLHQERCQDGVDTAAAALHSIVDAWREQRLRGAQLPPVVIASAHRLHNETRSALLRLPDALLHSIATRAGPHLRLTCHRVAHAYGPPGTTLIAPTAPDTVWTLDRLQHTHAPTEEPPIIDPSDPPAVALLHSVCTWPWRPLLLSLELPPDLVLHPTTLDLISAAHSHLRSISLASLATRPFFKLPAPSPHRYLNPPPTPLPSVTSLTLRWPPPHVDHLVTFAPNLQSLVAFSDLPRGNQPQKVTSLAALPLRHLQWPLGEAAAPEVFETLASTLSSLTLLTHLALITPVADIPESAQQPLQSALTSLPELVSLTLELPIRYGPNMQSTLESMTRLTALQLICPMSSQVPDVAAMSSLRRLTLDWMLVNDVMWDTIIATPPATNLQALSFSLDETMPHHVPLLLLGSFLEHFPALTALTTLHPNLLAPSQDQSESLHARLRALPGLQRLHLDIDLWGSPFCYSTLTCLTSLQLVFSDSWSLEDNDLAGLRLLTGLRQLVIRDQTLTNEEFGRLVVAALELPHLEELDVGGSMCWEELERALLPPPERLRRVVFVPPIREQKTYLERVAVAEEKLRRHLVDVVVQHRRWSQCRLGAD